MKYSERDIDFITADSIRQINYKQKKLLLASEYDKNPDRKKYADALIKILGDGVYNKIRADFCSDGYRESVCRELEMRHVQCVTSKSDSFPEQLKHIGAPPLVLYLRGNASLLGDNLFGIVGSRKTLPTSAAICTKCAKEITEHFTVVTGVASGADTAAVEGALASGKIICVLPSGHDGQVSASAALLSEVEKVGLSISEYPPLVPALKHTFLLRNRIIAGLCRGVLVVSAAQKSGAINTASYAAEYGKDVFAFPYSVGIGSGEGCNQLIKNGATLVESASDIFVYYGYEKRMAEHIELDEDERELLALLKEEGELHIERIAQVLNKKTFEITAVCSSLEIKGLIVKTGGNQYAAI